MDVKLNRQGCTRWVLIVGSVAIKIPALYSYRHFLLGLLANMQERKFSKVKIFQGRLCPIIFSDVLGLCVIMPRVKVLTEDELPEEKLRELCHIDEHYTIPAELKPNSFGWYKNQLVIIDYG